MNIKWMFFDIGNVLCHLDFNSVWDGFINECNVTLETVKEALYNEDLFNAFECGKITPEKYYNGVKNILGCSLNYDRFMKIWNSIIVKNNDMFTLVKSLKSKYGILILSNTNALNAEVIDSDLRELADKIIYSFQVGFMKPDKKIFKLALEYVKVSSEYVLFIDDLEENILAAGQLGFNTYLFEGYQEFKKYIKENLQM